MAVKLPSGRQATFGDSLHMLTQGFPGPGIFGLWRFCEWALPPGKADRFFPVILRFPHKASFVEVLPMPPSSSVRELEDEHKSHKALVARLSVAHQTMEGSIWRRLLFAWTFGLQVASAFYRAFGFSSGLPSMRVAAVVVPYLPQRGALLLTRRAARGGAYNSMWVFPGGGVDGFENPADAAGRELFEETGLKAKKDSIRFLCAYQARNEAQCLTYLMLIYRAEVLEAESALKLCRKEVAQAAFLPPSSAVELLNGGCPAGCIEGVAHSSGSDEELVEQSVPLADLTLARDGPLSAGPGIGGGHWFAMREWCRSGGAETS
eukprot:TRINITY_DN12006_c1_g1_i2.p1 TRINITY_DN12006_c1_g1~~TRINITY_DN12006_c1_g1_i2.p1  ORF type:complete len:364 (-),score=59.46 TRINITY_DN12006_c1_g1_i2:50-1009(-)